MSPPARLAARLAAGALGVVLIGGLVAMARPSRQSPDSGEPRGVPISGGLESTQPRDDPPQTLEERLAWEQLDKADSHTTNIESLLDEDGES